MVILVDSFIAAHKVQHKNVEIDFLSVLCLLSGMDFAEIWKMPSATGREEGSSGHFQDALQPTGTELPFNPGFERKYNLHWLCVFSSLISVSPQSVSASLRAGRGLRKTTFPQSVKADI